jgi:molybdopterin synthase catalytic subunit
MPAAHVAVTDRPIDSGALLEEVVSASDGAVLLFLGVVRNENDGREVDHLEYEAYAPMAERVLGQIALEAAERWSIGVISVVHRVGRLDIGEASVAIALGAPHRADAYAASRYVIDEIKHRVPVWKREGYTDGASEWLPGTVPRIAAEGSGA